MSVVGFDDIESYSPHPAMLTTVHQPFYQMGRRAARLLHQRIEQGASAERLPRQHILLPTRLVVRSTSGPAAR
jgi:DNA-binding LacI/PurR family transcriptional regulator